MRLEANPHRHAYLETSAGRLELGWWGPPPDVAPTLVLLHEGLGSVSTWRDFPAALQVRTGCGIIAYSRAGYGRSAPCALPRPVSYMHHEARVLAEVLDQIAVEQAVLIGHSDGASIASIYAAERPIPAVRGLVSIAPHFFVEEMTVEAIRQTKQAFLQTDLRARLERHHGTNVDVAFAGWSEAWLDPTFRSWDLTSLLPRITLPTLIIQGTEDPYGSFAQVRAAETGITGPVEVLALRGCGHVPHREAEEATAQAVARFALRTLDGDRPLHAL